MMLILIGLTYLLAAVPFGLVISTLYGGDADVRLSGSGNIGATNVARVYGWNLALPVLALDLGKGFVPVLFARLVWPELPLAWPILIALVAFVGHCWSVYLEFRGGKGVATGAGAMLALAPVSTLVAFAAWLTILRGTGRSSLASLVSVLVLVGACSVLTPDVVPATVLLGLGVVVTHLPNIQRLIRGEEKHIIRPVRWGRKTQGVLGSQQVLEAGPTGSLGHAPLWKERDIDPLEEITGARLRDHVFRQAGLLEE